LIPNDLSTAPEQGTCVILEWLVFLN
jgi:hypothetical protein